MGTGSKMNGNGNGKQNEGKNGNGKERERELKKKIKYRPAQGPHNRLGSKMNGNGKEQERERTGTGMNGNGKQNDASAETFLLKSQQRASGLLVCYKNVTFTILNVNEHLQEVFTRQIINIQPTKKAKTNSMSRLGFETGPLPFRPALYELSYRDE